jgi:hypothetical protein
VAVLGIGLKLVERVREKNVYQINIFKKEVGDEVVMLNEALIEILFDIVCNIVVPEVSKFDCDMSADL